MKLRVVLLAAIAVMSMPGLARAALLTFDWLGTITNVQGGGTAYSLGETIKLSVTYDSAIPMTEVQFGAMGSYRDGNLKLIRFGNEILAPGIGYGTILVTDNYHLGRSIYDEAKFRAGDGAAQWLITFYQLGSPPSVLNSMGLPTSILNPAAFDTATASFSRDGALYFARIDTVQSAVPEPSTWALMLIGFAGVGYGVAPCEEAGFAAA